MDSSRLGGASSSCRIDAEPDAKRLLVGLPVDVARALLDGVDQHHVDQLHDGRLVGRLLQLEHARGALFVVEDLNFVELAAEHGHHVGDRHLSDGRR